MILKKTKLLSTVSVLIYKLVKTAIGKIYFILKRNEYFIKEIIFFLSGLKSAKILAKNALKSEPANALIILSITVIIICVFSIAYNVSEIIIGFVNWIDKDKNTK